MNFMLIHKRQFQMTGHERYDPLGISRKLINLCSQFLSCWAMIAKNKKQTDGNVNKKYFLVDSWFGYVFLVKEISRVNWFDDSAKCHQAEQRRRHGNFASQSFSSTSSASPIFKHFHAKIDCAKYFKIQLNLFTYNFNTLV